MAHTPRVYVPGHIGATVRLDESQSRRLATVVRLRPGDSFNVFSGDGREWRASVDTAGPRGLSASVHELVRQAPLPPLALELWCGLVRPNRFDWAIEKCVEAGADVIRPLVSENSARGEAPSASRQERWERIAIEAAEQSGRLFLPSVEPAARFDDLLAARAPGPLLVADPRGKPWRTTSALLPTVGRLTCVVGPEGGFTDTEISLAETQGALLLSLGQTVLRTETAAVVLTALVRSAL
jgi:16S rRNA (uracil1498-N3)-methyltransferase